MQEMTLKEIQQVGLEMMKDIHLFCVENNIKYSLAYGSLIGAIRHKGFIPWDDDVDIWMLRPDYERFCKSYVSKVGYKLMSPYENDNYFYFAKVYDDIRTHVEMAWKHHKGDIGVWIDIFPIDGVSDNKEEFLSDYAKIRNTRRKINSLRASYTIIGKKHGFIRIALLLKYYIKVIFYGNINKLRRMHTEQCSEHKYGYSEHCSSLCCVDAYRKNKPECFDTSDFSDCSLVDFEGEKFYISNSYDKILRSIYGEYMVIPPKEQRESHLTKDGEHFYWK